jgi:hypothetical protein
MLRTTLLALAASATFAASAAGQSAPADSALVPGARSFAFSVSGAGTGSFGVWRMRSEHLNAGWELGLGAYQAWNSTVEDPFGDRESTSTQLFVEGGPRFRRYAPGTGDVRPFVQSGASVGYALHSGSVVIEGESFTGTSHTGMASASVGIGAEWFPTARFSLSGHTGISAHVAASFGRSTPSGAESTSWRVGAGTFTSGLALRLYLPPAAPAP